MTRLCFTVIVISVLAAHVLSQAQTPDIKPESTASISGRITIGDKPVAGVKVVVTSTASIQIMTAGGVSDAEGKYHINGLMPGPIMVVAAAPSYVVPAQLSGPGRFINLSAGENVEGFDFKLVRAGVITGRITDGDGKPVIDERITLNPVNDKGEPGRVILPRPPNTYVYATDDRGIYRIYGLPAGRYKVSVGEEVRMATLRAGFYERTYYGDTTDAAKATIVEVSEGGESKNIDINIGNRGRTYSISGHIVDAETNQPIAGIQYAFGALQQNQGQQYVSGIYSNSNPTNAKGEFRLDGVAPGRYALTPSDGSYSSNPAVPKVFSDPVVVEVIDSDVTDVEIRGKRGLIVSGTVLPDGITNKNALSAISKMNVTVYIEPNAPNGIRMYSCCPTARIAPDGSFQFDGLPPGRASLNIGYSAQAIPGVSLNGFSISRVVTDHELPNRQLELVAGQNVSGVRIYLIYGSGVLKGEVKVEGGALPGDATMFIRVQRTSPPAQVATASVDALGRFVVNNIPTGVYEAILEIGSNDPDALPPNFQRRYRQTVSVTNDAESQITFTLNLSKQGP